MDNYFAINASLVPWLMSGVNNAKQILGRNDWFRETKKIEDSSFEKIHRKIPKWGTFSIGFLSTLVNQISSVEMIEN